MTDRDVLQGQALAGSLVSRRQMMRGGAALGAGILASGGIRRQRVNAQGTPAAEEATVASGMNADIVAAANAFVATLTDEEKAAGIFDFSDMEQRQRWSNFPEGLFTRDGLMWGNLTEASQDAWLALMQATMSESGYTQVMGEWAADQALADGQGGQGGGGGGTPPDGGTGGPPNGGNGGPGGQQMLGAQYYWVALIGEPSDTTPWQWQWGGHHVTVNATIVGDNIALTPSFIGIQPAVFTDANGVEQEPLGPISDAAFALVNALNDDQKQQAILGDTYIDLVLGPGQDGKVLQPEGLLLSDMDADQQQLATNLISFYTGLVNDTHAVARLEQVTSLFDQTYFVWYGPTEVGSASYFRVAGPTIVIEFSPQGMGGNAADHIHGIYRDPSNDYGVQYTG